MVRCSLSSNSCSDQRRHAPQAEALSVNRVPCHLPSFGQQVRVMTFASVLPLYGSLQGSVDVRDRQDTGERKRHPAMCNIFVKKEKMLWTSYRVPLHNG